MMDGAVVTEDGMRRTAATAAFLLGLMVADGAAARVVIGTGLGVGKFDYSDLGDGSATSLRVAYETDSPFYFEFARVDSGDGEFDNRCCMYVNVRGTLVGGGYRWAPRKGPGFLVGGGIYDTEATLADTIGELYPYPASVKFYGRGLYLGAASEWMLSATFGLRVDLQRLLDVNDHWRDKSVTLIMVGPVFKFGASE